MFVEGGENLNFAIPVNDAKALLQRQSAKVQPLPNEVPRDVISKATRKKFPRHRKRHLQPLKKFLKQSLKEFRMPMRRRSRSETVGTGQQKQRLVLEPTTTDEPRVEYASHYDTASARCYVESKFYWDNGKKNPPKRNCHQCGVCSEHRSEPQDSCLSSFGA